MWTALPSSAPVRTGHVCDRPKRTVLIMNSIEFGRIAVVATCSINAVLWRRVIAAISASHSCAADSASVLSTVCRSNVERLITLSTSAVAVCCCSDSRSLA